MFEEGAAAGVTEFEVVHQQRREAAEVLEFIGVIIADRAVEDADCAEAVFGVRAQRCRGVRPEPGIAGLDWVMRHSFI